MGSFNDSEGQKPAEGQLRFEKSIGRIGALAVALGVGFGLGTPLACGVANATGPDAGSSADGGASSGRSGSGTASTGRQGAHPRRANGDVSKSGSAVAVPEQRHAIAPRAASSGAATSETALPRQRQVPASAATDNTDGGVVGSPSSVAVKDPVAAARPIGGDGDPGGPVRAPITLKSIVTDALTWIGLGGLAPSLPIPDAPVPPFFEGLWLGVRGFQRTVNNQRPGAHPALLEPDPDGTIRGNVNATDFDGDSLTYSVSKPAAKGEVSVDADGSFTYQPGEQITATGGKDTFTIRIDDGATHGLVGLLGLSGPGSATITVTVAAPVGPVNHAPTNGVADVHDPDVDGKVTGIVTATDPDGDTLKYSRTTLPSKGSVVVNDDGSFTYTPTVDARHGAAANGAGVVHDGFTVTATDGKGGTLAVLVSVVVRPVNAAPGAVVVQAGTPNLTTGVVTGSVHATDADNDTLTYTVSAQPGRAKNLTFDSATGAFSYTPTDAARQSAAGGGPTSDVFTVTITDGHGGSATTGVNVTVAPLNHAPINGVADIGVPGSDGKVTGTVSATDPDGNSLSYSGTTTTSHGAVVVNSDGSFTYSPTPTARHGASANGAGVIHDGFSVTVSDGNGGTLAVPVSVVVSPKNSAPGAISVDPGSPNAVTGVVTGSVHATDADQDTLTYTVSTQPSHAQQFDFNSTTGTFTYKPTEDARHAAANGGSTTDSFAITITDGYGGTTTTNVTVTVAQPLPVNHAPVAGNDAATTKQNTSVSIAVLANDSDADDDTLTVTGTATPLHGSVTHSGTGVTYTPNADYYGADSFTYTISDGNGGSATATVNVTVSHVTDTPPTGTPVDGLPFNAPVTTLDGTVYQLLTNFSGVPNSSGGADRVVIIDKHGTPTTVALPGAITIAMVARPGGDVIVTTVNQVDEDRVDESSYRTLVSVIRPNGAISTTEVIGLAISKPVVATNGTAYQMVMTAVDTGIVAGDGTHVTAHTLVVLRVDPGGAVSTQTLGAVPEGTVYGHPTGNVVTDAQGNGYVAFGGATISAAGGFAYSAGIMVIPAHGTAYLSDPAYDNFLAGPVVVTPDGTAYAAFLDSDSSTMVMKLSGHATTLYRNIVGNPDQQVGTVPETIVVGAGGAAYLVTTTFSTDDGSTVSHITRIGGPTIDVPVRLETALLVAPDGGAFQALSLNQVLVISPGGGSTTVTVDATNFVLGPDGKGYAPTTDHVTVVTTGGTTSDIALGGTGASPLVFGPDGTPFQAVDIGTGYVIKNLSTGATSGPVVKSGNASSGGVLAIGPDGTAVFVPVNEEGATAPVQILTYTPDGSTIISSPINGGIGGFAFGPDGTAYVGVIGQGADGSFGTTIVTITSNGATTGPTVNGLTAQMAATDHGVYAFVMSITAEGGFGNTQLISLPAVPNAVVPATTVTKTVNKATGVVTGQITAGTKLGEGVSWSGSATTALGSLVVGRDGTFTFTPTAAARAYAEESGKVYNVIGSFTATNSAGESYTIPFNVPLLPRNYPVTPSTPQFYPLHTVYGAGSTWGGDPDSLISNVGLVSAWFGEPALEWTPIHMILDDGRDFYDCHPCSGHGEWDWDYTEYRISYTGHPDLTHDADGFPVNADVYLLSILRVPGMKTHEGLVLGYRKMAKGDVTYVKSDMANKARVGNDGLVQQAYIEYDAIEVVPGSFPENWFYQRDPGDVGGFIYNNELPSEAMMTEVDREYTEAMTSALADRQRAHKGLEIAGNLASIFGSVAVDPLTGVFTVAEGAGKVNLVIKAVKAVGEGKLGVITDPGEAGAATMALLEGPSIGATPTVGIPD